MGSNQGRCRGGGTAFVFSLPRLPFRLLWSNLVDFLFPNLPIILAPAYSADINSDMSVGGNVADSDLIIGDGNRVSRVGQDKRTSVEGGLQINFVGERPGYGGGGGGHRRKATPEEITERLLVLIDGSADLGVVGMRTRIRQLWAAVISIGIAVFAMLIMQIVLVVDYFSRG